MTYSAVDFFVAVAAHHYESSFSVFLSHGPLVDSPVLGEIGVIIRCSFVSLSYGIFEIHFLYRYINLCRTCIVMMLVNTLSVAVIVSYFVLGYKVSTLSLAAKRVHRQLFMALIAQTTIPFVVSFLPCLLIWYTPMFGISLGSFNNYYTIPMFSAFPLCDPIAIIAIFSEYRAYILKRFGIKTAVRNVRYSSSGSRQKAASRTQGFTFANILISSCKSGRINYKAFQAKTIVRTCTVMLMDNFISLSVITSYFVLGYKINKQLKISTISPTAKRVHRQLFLALIIQTTIPFLVSFLPCLLIWYAPLFDINLGSFNNNYAIPMFSAFPFFDPIAIIAIFSEYRAYVLKHIGINNVSRSQESFQMPEIELGAIPKWLPRFFCLLSFIFNPILIYLVLTQNKCKIGPYRQLLVCFALFDMTYSAVDVIVGMAVHHYETAFIVFVSHGPLVDNPVAGQIGVIIRCSFICLSYGTFELHFIYRYIALCRPQLVHWFTHPVYIFRWFLFWISFGFYWAFACSFAYLNKEDRDFLRENFRDNYNVDIDDLGVLGVRYKVHFEFMKTGVL
ncbi:unnamed protein product [Caenorhabditis auriculariae]|uniref:G protein-coupled receptor n=1 Tax=Caenorhabditis auriculariae TaxID=2777116 RepID=A0A8S1HDJ2_9PELO|nr:unnamed protein product [Caenorhabditis auriculariae]